MNDILLERLFRNVVEISRLLDIFILVGGEGRIDAVLLSIYRHEFENGYIDKLLAFAQRNGAVHYNENDDYWEITAKGKLIRQLSFDETYIRHIFESHPNCSLRTLLEEIQSDQEYNQSCQNTV